MITKLATFRGQNLYGEPVAQVFRQGDSVQKLAGNMMPEVQDWLGTYNSDLKKIALLVNALGASEYWGQNVNGDIFPWDALCHDCRKHTGEWHPVDSFTGQVVPPYGYSTFLTAHMFAHHRNKDPSRAFGTVQIACLNPKMRRVELVVLIDRDQAAQFGGQAAVDRIDTGDYPDVSMGCFLAGTMVTMDDGTRKPIEEVEEGDRVLTHRGHARKVVSTHVRKYKGDVYSIKAEAHPVVRCTHAHEFFSAERTQVKRKDYHANWKWNDGMVGEPDWVPAEDLHRREQFLLEPIFAAEPTVNPYPLSGTRAEARLLGYYLAEGHLLRNKSKAYSGIELTTHEDDYVHEEIDELCSLFGTKNPPAPFRRSNSETSVGVSIFDQDLAMLCLRHAAHYSNSKKLSPEVMAAPEEYIKELLGAYGNGDGCGSDGALKFSTSSEDLAHQVLLLLTKIGCMASLSKIVHPPSGFAKTETVEWVAHVGKQWVRILEPYCAKAQPVEILKAKNSRLRFGDQIVTPIREISSVYAETDVYNLEVEEDESYLVEGLAVHNCRVPYDICTICGHKSRTRKDYCDCIRLQGMNTILPDGRRVGVVNTYPRFFDISFVFIGADKTAKVMCKLGSGLWVPQSVRDGITLYGDGEDEMGLIKAAGVADSPLARAALEKRYNGQEAAKLIKMLNPDPSPESMLMRTPLQIIEEKLQDERDGFGDGALRTNAADGVDNDAEPEKLASAPDVPEEMAKAAGIQNLDEESCKFHGGRWVDGKCEFPRSGLLGYVMGDTPSDEEPTGEHTQEKVPDAPVAEKEASWRYAMNPPKVKSHFGTMERALQTGGSKAKKEGKNALERLKEKFLEPKKKEAAKDLKEPPTRDQFPYAGQYKWNGMTILVENPTGTWRKGKGWATKMKNDYGEIQGSLGSDGDPVDVYVGPNEKAKNVYIIHQNHARGPKSDTYDEDKAMLGFPNARAAKKAYLAHYDSPRFFRSITEMSLASFKKMVMKGETDGEKIASGLNKEAFFGWGKKKPKPPTSPGWTPRTDDLEAHTPEWQEKIIDMSEQYDMDPNYVAQITDPDHPDAFEHNVAFQSAMQRDYGGPGKEWDEKKWGMPHPEIGQKTASASEEDEKKLADLFNFGNVRRERLWKDKVTGEETYEVGSGLGTSFKNLKKTASAEDPLAAIFGVKAAADKKAEQDKAADIDKDVDPDVTTGRVVDDLTKAEPEIPQDLLSAMAGKDLRKALSTPSMMGFVLKPKEFQRIILTSAGEPGLADEMDEKGEVFGPSEDIAPPCGPLGPDHFDSGLMKSLLPMVSDRSFFGPVLKKRVVMIKVCPKPPEEEPATPVESPLLSKVGAAYNWYRREMMSAATHAPEVLSSHPDLQAQVFGLSDSDLFSKSASDVNTIGAVLASIPLSLMYSASIRRDMDKGEDPGLMKRLIAEHPNLSAVGSAALVREAMKNEQVNRAVGNAARELAATGKRIWTGGA